MYERLSYKNLKYKYFVQAYKSNIKKYIKNTKKNDLKILEHFVFCDTVHNCENDYAIAWNVLPLDECIDETNFIIYQKFNIKKFFSILQHIEDFYEWED